ncbi:MULTISPECIES: histidine phosphatase family protein [unclassified Clostridium]|uniref:histidine phosphatase family protein n=1 Tax=unclassified Clostridium TaxID=2614128 RepID=UPI00029805C2|nr:MULTISPECIES: histidine phosphatase family protein [unclassified Clostridium]EKQ57070.1 MAG: fructose-2,6-bisphosphatase [Clostridium sp. Maddingley MBC34-26]
MIIGLIRHFKVNYQKKLFMTSKEFKEWEENYNKSDVIRKDIELMGIKWDKCYSSTLIRAMITAQHVYKDNIVQNDLIRETIIDPIFKSNLKLPYWFWAVSGRAAWYFNHKSQEENRRITKEKAKQFVDLLLNEAEREKTENILIVTHGFFMYSLQKELKKRKFKGKLIYNPQNGILYLYKK